MSVPGMTPRATSGSSSAAAAAVDRLAWMAGQDPQAAAPAGDRLRRGPDRRCLSGGLGRLRARARDARRRRRARRRRPGSNRRTRRQPLARRTRRDAGSSRRPRRARRRGDRLALARRRRLGAHRPARRFRRLRRDRDAVALGAAAAVSGQRTAEAHRRRGRRCTQAGPSLCRPGASFWRVAWSIATAAFLALLVAVVDPASLIAEMAERDASRGGVALGRTDRPRARRRRARSAAPWAKACRSANRCAAPTRASRRRSAATDRATSPQSPISPLAVVATPPDLDRDPRLMRWRRAVRHGRRRS